ncbi:hypothetical protein [Paenibacillus glycinis]|uniref:Gfo/Idh/MocA-like oxidoreductase C-terminal domain-containing protein n=1 Tax=Paenibacillus glycinis TaxID=2697035 RepID=A0ABW9XT05_9BACL|nr:hypothetical protein [Paenibacillus glycinis]NBD25779.1 hypothetical protein [Paenibacillus glycinis]
MYLDTLNRQWRAFMLGAGFEEAASVRLTNTAKLTGIQGMNGACLLEFERAGARHHFYSMPGEADELRRLDGAYAAASWQDAIGIQGARADAFANAAHAFVALHLPGVQTSVDCSGGLRQAQDRIRDIRLAQWRPSSRS